MRPRLLPIAFLVIMRASLGLAQSLPVSVEVKSFPEIYKATGITRVDVSEDCKYICGVSELGQVFLLDLSTSKISKIALPETAITSACYSSDGLSLYIGETDGDLSMYDIASGKISETIKPMNGIRQISRLGLKSLLIHGGSDSGRTAIVELNEKPQMKLCSVKFTESHSITAYGGGLHGIICETGVKLAGNRFRIVVDKDLNVVLPRFRFNLDEKGPLDCVGVCRNESWKTVYSANLQVYCETEDVVEIKKSTHRFKNPPLSIFHFESYWLVFGKQSVAIFNDELELITETPYPESVSIDPGTSVSFASTKKTAVLAVANDRNTFIVKIQKTQ